MQQSFLPFILLCILSISCSSANNTNNPPLAKRGVINLKGWNHRGSVELNGEWEFYWKKLLTVDDFSGKAPPPDCYVMIPSAWNGLRVGNTAIDGNGYATYRLILHTDAIGTSMAFRIIDMRTAYRFFVNGRQIASNGTVGTNRASSVPQYLPLVVEYIPETERLELILQISNFHHAKGGAFHSITFGTKESVYNIRNASFFIQAFLLGSLLIMALYHLGLFLLRRNDLSPLYLAAFCLLISLRPLVTGEYFLIQLWPDMPWDLMLKLEYLTLYLGLPTFATFMNSLFPIEFPKRVLRLIQAVGGVFSLIVIVAPAAVYSKTVQIYEIITAAACVFTFTAVIRAARQKREGARIFLTGTFAMFVTVINEILYDNMLVNTGNFVPFGLFVFVLSQAFLLSHRFSKAYTSIENLSRELEAKNIRLLELDRIKDDFLANTSHELRTPLHGMIGIAESLIEDYEKKPSGETKRELATIVASGKRLSVLIDDILDFSKLRNRDITLETKAVDMRTVVDMAVRMTFHLKGDRPVEVINNIPVDLPLVLADENRMQQVMINLISNALKFTDRGSVEITGRTIFNEQNEIMAEIIVSDTGIGIPADKIDAIFEPFQQADGSISRLYGGIGLGLTITRDLIHLHGGTIDVESEHGRGTAFRFRIPIHHVGDVSSRIPLDATIIESRSSSGDEYTKTYPPTLSIPTSNVNTAQQSAAFEKRHVILAVDDDPLNLKIIENHLSSHGYQVVKAMSGQQALDILSGGVNPDLILLDVMMPRMSGIEFAHIVRKSRSVIDLPILMLTAKSRPEDIAAGLEAGANDYLPKPFDRKELLARVKTLISLKESMEERKRLSTIIHDLETARRIQMATIPKRIPNVPGLAITTRYLPMEQIGGDFYDFHDLGDDRIGVFIADVSGHGVPAALIASMVKIAFSTLRGLAERPDELMNEMNRILTQSIEDQFITAGYAFIDRSSMTLSYARAGHEPLLILRRDGELRELVPPGPLIGISPRKGCGCSSVDLKPGDRMILYTDGITEVSNPERQTFDFSFFKDLIVRTRDISANQFIDHLTSLLEQWQESSLPFEDDATIVVVDVI